MPCTLHQTSLLVLTDTKCQNSGWQYSRAVANKMSDLRGAVTTFLWKVRPIRRKSTCVTLKNRIHTAGKYSFIYQPFSQYSRHSRERFPQQQQGKQCVGLFLSCSTDSIVQQRKNKEIKRLFNQHLNEMYATDKCRLTKFSKLVNT